MSLSYTLFRRAGALLSLSALVCLATLAAPAEAQVLLHRYSFNGSAADAIGTANGTAIGSVVLSASAATNGLAAFSGGTSGSAPGYVSLPVSSVNGLQNATIEIFTTSFNPPKNQPGVPGGQNQTLFAAATPYGNTANFLHLTANASGAGLGFSAQTNGAGAVSIVAHDPLPDWQQNHIVDLVFSGFAGIGTTGTVTLYLDGRQVAQGQTTCSFAAVAAASGGIATVGIGGGSPWNDPTFNGSINEVRIYQGALTIGQIAANVAAGPGSPGLYVSSPVVTYVSSSSVSISWTTNTAADTTVSYGPTASYGTTVTGAAGVTSHSVTLTGLNAGTVYDYSVSSADGAGQAASSPDGRFLMGVWTQPLPHGGWPAELTMPGRVEAENYDDGGEGMGYHSQNTTNPGGQYRNDGVGIETTSDVGGGYDVGWLNFGDWLEYTFQVPQTLDYSMTFRLASPNTGGSFRVLVDGNSTATITVPNTGGWQTWQSLQVPGIHLTSGTHAVRLLINTGGFNLNWMDVWVPAATTTTLTSSLNPSPASQPVTFTATVAGSGSPTGAVTFSDGTAMLGTGPLSGGVGTFSIASLTAGTHQILASYAGDPSNAASVSAALNQTVTATTSTTLTVPNFSGSAGQTVTLSATLKKTGGVALSGKTLTFSLDGTTVGTSVTNGSGTAIKSYAIPSTLTVGSHTLTVAFAGDSINAASTGSATLTVTPAPTTPTVSAVSGTLGQTVTLHATLKRTLNGAILSGATVSFSVDGATVGTAVTSGAGLASLTYVIPASDAIGSSHPITATFAGDASDNASSGTANLTVSKFAVTLAVTAITGVPGQTVTMTGTLKKSGGAGLSGETISFTVDGAAAGTALTNTSGIATLSDVIPANASIGSHPIVATFAGDSTYLAGTGHGALTVKYATTLTAVNTTGARGTSVTLSATLTQTVAGTGISGKTVTFKLDGKAAGSGVTNSAGVASVTYAIASTATVGSHAISVSFVGDTGDNAATGTGTLIVN